MKLKEVPFTQNLEHTLEMMRKHGLLLTSVGGGGRKPKPNTMAIGWGTPGILWSRPIFVVYVRPTRFTFQNIEASGEFVVSVPADDMHETCMYCGTVSGRDVDKFAEQGLRAVRGKTVRVPLIEQCVRHYECKVVHRNDVIDSALDADVRADNYAKGNFHRIYFGQILRTTERA